MRLYKSTSNTTLFLFARGVVNNDDSKMVDIVS